MKVCIRLSKEDEYWLEKVNELKEQYPQEEIVFHYGDDLNMNGIDVLVSSHIKKEEIESANQLKSFILTFTGVNHLPLDELKEHHIRLFNSHANAMVIAEKALALSLSMLSRIVELHNQFLGGWNQVQDTQWTSLFHKRIGMLGMGAIGQEIVKLLSPFQCELIALERYQGRFNQDQSVTYYNSIQEVCEHSDVVFISLPLTNDTRNLVDETILSHMHGKYIINVGRAEIINEKDLYNALANNVLKGAGLDVWYRYPKTNNFPSQYPFHELDNVIISPHCSANTLGSRKRAIDDVIHTIDQMVNDHPITNEVYLSKGY